MMTRAFRIALTFVCLLSFAHGASAATITFEGFASPGDQVINVNPGSPYSEAGFTLMPTNDESAVFDSTTGAFPGDTTDFFGFGESNVITLTGPTPFSLATLLLGPSVLANDPATASFTLVGNLVGGGTLNAMFPNLTTATLATLNWSNLSSAVFSATDDAALDNIVVNEVPGGNEIPEPTTVSLLGFGLAGIYARRRRQGKAT
jgi:PEP-CTERM motif